MRYVAEIEYWNPDTVSVEKRYFGTRGFSTSPSSTPPATTIEPRVANPASVRRDVFDIGTVGGFSRVGYGELELVNTDGALDVFQSYGFDGRSLVLRTTDNDTGAEYPTGWTTLFTGTMEQVEISQQSVRIRIRDRQVYATSAFQPNKYAGTNILPEGLEGISTDLKGKPKPILLGYARNVSPVTVNTSKLIYQVHDGEIRDVLAVYDSGALLTRNVTDYVSEADLLANQPNAGEYRVWKGGGYFRLGSSPAGQVTCDAVQGLWPVDRTAGAMFYSVLTAAGVSPANISEGDVATLKGTARAVLGLYVRDETTNQAVLDEITRSVGAWWASDADGVIRVQRLEIPVAPATLRIDESRIVEGTLRRVPLTTNGLPVHLVRVRACQNYTVQNTGLVGSVGPARRARLSQPFQDATDTEPSVLTAHPLSPELEVDTKMACLDNAQQEATRLLEMYGTRRDRFDLDVQGNGAWLRSIELGAVVMLVSSRYTLQAGKLVRVIGYQLNPDAKTASLTVWG